MSAFWFVKKCDALDINNVFSLYDFIVIVTSPFVSLMILLIGRYFYQLIRTKVVIQYPVRFKIYSFVIVSFLSLLYPISIILQNFLNESVILSICEKSTSNIRICNSKNLNLEEYQYIANTNNFPKIPIQSKVINIFYAEDDFLGDYSVKILFKLGIKDKFNNSKRWDSEEWKVIKIDSTEKTKTIRYYDAQR
ncbi:MAG: hypothetical protein ACK5B9_06980 [Flavobacteriia bacterium]